MAVFDPKVTSPVLTPFSRGTGAGQFLCWKLSIALQNLLYLGKDTGFPAVPLAAGAELKAPLPDAVDAGGVVSQPPEKAP